MKTGFPDWFEEALLTGLDLDKEKLRSPQFLDAIRELNRGWVKEEVVLPADYGREALLRQAYAAFYMPINLPKLWFMWDRHAASIPDGEELTVVEVGCGPGTFLWAAAIWLSARRPGVKLRLLGVDASPSMLATAERLANAFDEHLAAEISFEALAGDWRELQLPAADFAIVGNVLTEADSFSASQVLAIESALLTIIEPGTSASFARLRELRDIAGESGWACRFPCPATTSVCPMAADNWCHFHVNRLQLPLVQRLCNAAGRKNPRHHFCGFLFEHGGESADEPDWRVLSRLRKSGRSGIRYLCDGSHMPEVVLNRRAKTTANKPFLEADAGDLLRIETAAPPQQLRRQGRLGANDSVEVVSEST